ncbi:MAG: hypothetical protein D6722_23430 [Bacteroidetes bacterium]|nr:MAG: hypothetical protein D6722_23430 [Bacteroidota bacterium]
MLLRPIQPGVSPTDEGQYYFSPSQDNLFVTPQNWLPSYPGAKVKAGETVTIQGVAYIPHFDLEIEGTLIVLLDATLYVSQQSLRVLKGGRLINHGEIVAQTVDNAGQISNSLTANMDVHTFLARAGAEVENLRGGSFKAHRLILEGGAFQNYGTCEVKDTFDNRGAFQEVSGSEFILRESVQTIP